MLATLLAHDALLSIKGPQRSDSRFDEAQQAHSYELQVASYELRVTRYKSRVIKYKLPAGT